jgi:hypothetical protein
MEIKWHINKNKAYVHLKYYGNPEFDVWAEVMENIFSHPDYKPGFGFLADLTQSGAPDPDHLRDVKDFLIDHKAQTTGIKWANITTERPVHYGMTRMAQVFIEGLPMQINAFQTEEEAVKWLTISS